MTAEGTRISKVEWTIGIHRELFLSSSIGYFFFSFLLVGSTPPDQVNVLHYFQKLCCDEEVANMIISSTLTQLLVKFLRKTRNGTIKSGTLGDTVV